MGFEILQPIEDVETIATGRGIRELRRLRRLYGGQQWRKRKGIATVVFTSGEARRAEVHWYEAHGVGKREIKIKRFL